MRRGKVLLIIDHQLCSYICLVNSPKLHLLQLSFLYPLRESADHLPLLKHPSSLYQFPADPYNFNHNQYLILILCCQYVTYNHL